MDKPKGWLQLPLSKLITIRKGKKPSKLSFKKFIDSVPYLDIQAIEKGKVNQYADQYSTVISDENDLFIVADGSRSGLVGKGMNGAVGSTLLCITPIGLNPLYLFYFLKLKYDDLNGNTRGASIPHLDIEIFMNLKIPFPSQEEQERIVKEIEDQLDVFENDFSNAEEELLKLYDYGKSILNQAVIGNLTIDYRNNNKINSKNQLPQDWDVLSVDSISSFIGSGVTPSGGSSNYKEKGIPFLRSQNVYPNELRLSDVAYITKEMHKQMKRTHLKANDVLLNITGASIGRSAFIPTNFGEGNVNQHVCIIRPTDIICAEYLALFFNSPICQENINSLQKGVTRQGLNYDQIRTIKVNVPPKDEQFEIMNRFNLQYENIKELEYRHSERLNNVTSLEKSVLTLAYHGKLSKCDASDTNVETILDELDAKRIEINQKVAKFKKVQMDKSRTLANSLNNISVKDFINKNYESQEFSSDELFEALKLEMNSYDIFNKIMFDLLQDKLSEDDVEPFLEAKYDKKLKRQTFCIKKA